MRNRIVVRVELASAAEKQRVIRRARSLGFKTGDYIRRLVREDVEAAAKNAAPKNGAKEQERLSETPNPAVAAN